MLKVSVIIPNYNGIQFLHGVLSTLREQTFRDFEIVLVDNGSTDGSCEYVNEHFPEVRLIPLLENYGFSRAVNEGIYAAKSPYALLLNNDTEVDKNFVGEMYRAIRRHPKAFSCSSRMIQFTDREKLDDAGDSYCALGWSFARGKGKGIHTYEKEEQIFSACAGAAIYRISVFRKIGFFDDEHFAYLEDLDVGYRARIYGYENWYAPKAIVYHVGSGTSGSRYNQFKTRYSSRNNVYMIYKNMPVPQIILNLPLLLAGFGAKFAFFFLKGMGREYAAGIKNGFQISRKERKVPFLWKNFPNYVRIQKELLLNVVLRFIQ